MACDADYPSTYENGGWRVPQTVHPPTRTEDGVCRRLSIHLREHGIRAKPGYRVLVDVEGECAALDIRTVSPKRPPSPPSQAPPTPANDPEKLTATVPSRDSTPTVPSRDNFDRLSKAGTSKFDRDGLVGWRLLKIDGMLSELPGDGAFWNGQASSDLRIGLAS